MASSTAINELLETQEKKLAFFQNLILVALSDRELDSKEADFLVMIGDQLGLTEKDTKSITDNISGLKFIIPDNGLQKTMELQTLVMMMLQDGQLANKEYNMCLQYAKRIGYTKEFLDDLVLKLIKE